MGTDFLHLLRRDHQELEAGLRELLRPMTSASELRMALDGVRLGLTAHAEAEDIVLATSIARFAPPVSVKRLVAEGRAAHLEQEGALASLVCSPPGTALWRDRARHLLELVRGHADREETDLVEALAAYAPREVFDGLAGAFATERMRQLAMLQPSAPIVMPPELLAMTA